MNPKRSENSTPGGRQKTVIVTGGSSGIGLAIAERFGKLGEAVFVGDLIPPNQEVLGRNDHDIRYRECDVRRESELAALVKAAVSETGRVDVLVSNAGVGLVRQATDVTESEWETCIDTNLKAAFFGAKHAIRVMQKQPEGGCLVNMASNAGLLPRAHDPVYSISKMALVALTKSLALCHARDRIRINCVCPGPVERTKMMDDDLAAAADPDAARAAYIAASPLANAWNRMIDPDEVAEAVLYLCSPAARMVTGTAIAIDGGKSLGVAPDDPTNRTTPAET